MIFDTLENRARWSALGERFARGLDWLAGAEDPAPGRYELEGSDLYVNVQLYEPAGAEGRSYEAHGDYADIQCVLAGRERCALALEGPELQPYDPGTDAAFFGGEAAGHCTLTPGCFVIYFPGERHLPGIRDARGPVRKAVVKVRMDREGEK